MTVTVRFAPSPTGNIHIGNARTALFNWLFALKNGGRFVLRFDDTDVARSRQEYADQIQKDLHWLGVRPDVTVHQSARFDTYAAAVERLKASGVLYPCYETPEELELRRKVLLSRRLPPVYGREALKLGAAEKAALRGRRAASRTGASCCPISRATRSRRGAPTSIGTIWCAARETVDLASVSDPVLVREDGSYLYTLPSVVDDIELGISHVIRGDDHVTNTGVQIALFRALGAEPPVFGHHNMLTTASGEGLSKRSGALSIASLAESGIEPMAVVSLAVLIGTSESVSAVASMDELAARFEPAGTSKSASKFDPAELTVLNRTLIHHMPFERGEGPAAAIGVPDDKAEAFWLAVRGNLDIVADAGRWWRIVAAGPESPPELSDEDRAFVRDAYDFLPLEPWDHDTWKAWTDRVKEATGRKGRALYMPLRLALTGLASGPELSDLLPLLGREGTLARRP